MSVVNNMLHRFGLKAMDSHKWTKSFATGSQYCDLCGYRYFWDTLVARIPWCTGNDQNSSDVSTVQAKDRLQL